MERVGRRDRKDSGAVGPDAVTDSVEDLRPWAELLSYDRHEARGQKQFDFGPLAAVAGGAPGELEEAGAGSGE